MDFLNIDTQPAATLLEIPPEKRAEKLASLGAPAYRAKQIAAWIFQKRATSYDPMTNLPETLRRKLSEELPLFSTRLRKVDQAEDTTQKFLLELADGETVETVLLRDDRGHRTVCLSTQVGCGMDCAFCASGLGGLVRNLTRAEILEQMLTAAQQLPKQDRISHVVVMGMGEPLLNWENVASALDEVTSPNAMDISQRRITISTVGVPGGIAKVARAERTYHLAVSLHAPNQRLREELIPAAKNLHLRKLLSDCNTYFNATGRRVTYEYVLLEGINDSEADARELGELLRDRIALVNLIPYNPVSELKQFRRPKPPQIKRFADELHRCGVKVEVRMRKGSAIRAACGQLRRANATSKK